MKKFLCAALIVCLSLLSNWAVAPNAVMAQTSAATGDIRYAKKDINLFLKKSTSSKKLCVIAKGDKMTFLQASGSWVNVTYVDSDANEYTGFVKKSNISKTKPASDATPTPEPTIEPTPDVTEQPGETPTPAPDTTPEPSPSPSAFPFRPGGGGWRGSSGSSGNSQSEQSITDLLGITPGKALTSGHKSGSYSALAYGAVRLSIPQEPMTQLTVGNVALDVTLSYDNSLKPFKASVYSNDDASFLTLQPEYYTDNDSWHIDAGALISLRKSGVSSVIIELDGQNAASVSTQGLFSGVDYDCLRSGGVPESGIDIDIDVGYEVYEVYAVIDGQRRLLSDYDDKVFFAKGLTITDKRSLASALTTNAED